MLIEDVDLRRVVKKTNKKVLQEKKVPIKTWPLPETTLVRAYGSRECKAVQLEPCRATSD